MPKYITNLSKNTYYRPKKLKKVAENKARFEYRGGIGLKLLTVSSLTRFFWFFQKYPIIDDTFC